MKNNKNVALVVSVVVIVLLGFLAFSAFRKDKYTFTVKEKEYSRGVETITCTLKSKTILPIFYGNRYYIERFENGKWTEFNELDAHPLFELISHTLMPFSSAEKNYDVGVFSTFSEAGEYRIVAEARIGSSSNKSFRIYCPFTVK